jgi:hypothetical protein
MNANFLQQVLDYLTGALDALKHHSGTDFAWAPPTGLAALLVLSLVVLARGARLLPLGCALLLAGGGAWGGTQLSAYFGGPLWPMTVVSAAVGLALGWLFSRLWVATLLATGFAGGGVVLYTSRVLVPYIGKFFSGADLHVHEVILPHPNESVMMLAGLIRRDLWEYLVAHVQNLEMSLLAIVVSLALAGFVLGMLLPTLGRALLAAVGGTLMLAIGATGLLHLWGHDAWGARLGAWGWALLGGICFVSFVYNLLPRAAVAPKAKPAPAPAPAA